MRRARLTDACLTEARNGRRDAIAALYEEFAPAVTGYFRAQGEPDAEGLTGDVFVAVVRHLPRFVGTVDDFRTWLFTIAHHRLVDARRARRELAVDPGDLRADRASAPGPEDVSFEQVAVGPLHDALRSLTDDQRAVVMLRLVADLSVEATAAALGKRPGAIKTLQRRALAAMRRSMSGPGGTPAQALEALTMP